MTIAIRRLSPQEFSLHAPELVSIYLTAMGYSSTIHESRVVAWRREIARPGFGAVIAEDDTGIIGLAYGFDGGPDAWWDRQLRRGFIQAGGPTEQQWEMLHNYFELAEIHILPQYQGHGLGRKLMHKLLWGVSRKYVLLSTPEVPAEDNRAFGLYRSAGFVDVFRHFDYPGDSRKFAILAAQLPLNNASNKRSAANSGR